MRVSYNQLHSVNYIVVPLSCAQFTLNITCPKQF